MRERRDATLTIPCSSIPAVLAILLALGLLSAGCSGPEEVPRTDPQYGALVIAAEGRFAAGQTGQAVESFGRALQRARAMDDPAAISDCAYNLAACLLSLGDLDGACVYLLEARHAAERNGRTRLDALLLEAQIARLQGRTVDAAALCDEILSGAGDDDDETLWQIEVSLLQARLACGAGATLDARAHYDRAANHLDEIDDPHLRAEAALTEGEVLLLEGSHAAAARSFEAQARSLRRAGRYGDMAYALLRAGEASLDASDPAGAADSLFRGARSLFAQGEPGAQAAAQSARAAAQRANDPNLLERIDLLLLEIDEAKNQSP